ASSTGCQYCQRHGCEPRSWIFANDRIHSMILNGASLSDDYCIGYVHVDKYVRTRCLEVIKTVANQRSFVWSPPSKVVYRKVRLWRGRERCCSPRRCFERNPGSRSLRYRCRKLCFLAATWSHRCPRRWRAPWHKRDYLLTLSGMRTSLTMRPGPY